MRLRPSAILPVLLLAGLCACDREAAAPAAPAPTATDTTPAPPRVDAPEPEGGGTSGEPEYPGLRLATLDGGEFDLAARRGKWVVVNFWATWCSPCLEEMPELSALDAMREHVDVVGLAYEDIAPDDLRSFLRDHPVVYPIALVDVYAPPADFATPRGLPMTYLIAPDGRVADRFLGPVTAARLEAAIAAAGGPAPADAPSS
jgi:thiol-disulfide isomerase/thioredoxin